MNYGFFGLYSVYKKCHYKKNQELILLLTNQNCGMHRNEGKKHAIITRANDNDDKCDDTLSLAWPWLRKLCRGGKKKV